MSVDDNIRQLQDHQSAVTVTGERQVHTATSWPRRAVCYQGKGLNTASWLTKLTTDDNGCVVLWRLSQTTAPIDDRDLAAADKFTCNALDYKLLFTLNIQTAMFNISILTEGKQYQFQSKSLTLLLKIHWNWRRQQMVVWFVYFCGGLTRLIAFNSKVKIQSFMWCIF